MMRIFRVASAGFERYLQEQCRFSVAGAGAQGSTGLDPGRQGCIRNTDTEKSRCGLLSERNVRLRCCRSFQPSARAVDTARACGMKKTPSDGREHQLQRDRCCRKWRTGLCSILLDRWLSVMDSAVVATGQLDLQVTNDLL